MAKKFNILTVTLEQDINEDDAALLANAITQFRSVLNVTPHVADANAALANDRARHELGQALLSVLYPQPT